MTVPDPQGVSGNTPYPDNYLGNRAVNPPLKPSISKNGKNAFFIGSLGHSGAEGVVARLHYFDMVPPGSKGVIYRPFVYRMCERESELFTIAHCGAKKSYTLIAVDNLQNADERQKKNTAIPASTMAIKPIGYRITYRKRKAFRVQSVHGRL